MRKIFAPDLFLMVIIALITVIFVLVDFLNETLIRTVLGLLLVLFVPGYSLITALFPKKDDLSGIERFTLSFGLSIGVTPLIGLVLNYTPYGIRMFPVLISLSILTLFFCAVAFIRRRRINPENQFQVDFTGFFSSLRALGNNRKEKVLSVILIISALLAMCSTLYIIATPKEGEKFTEFYILGPEGKASNYPTNLTLGENGTVIIGIVNHESAPKTYQLVIAANGTLMDQTQIKLENNEKKEINYTFIAEDSGLKKMEFLLFKMPDNNYVYRSLHLWINILGGTE